MRMDGKNIEDKIFAGVMKAGLAAAVIFAVIALGLFLLMRPEKSCTVVENIPNSNAQLVIKEYKEFRSGYFDVFLREPGKKDRFLERGEFNEPFCPIAGGMYEIAFHEETATLRYPFSVSMERDDWVEIHLNLTL